MADMVYHIQLWPLLVNARNQQRHSERPTHHSILIVHTLSEPQRQVTYRLRHTLHLDTFIIRESMVLRRYACVVDHGSCVCNESRHGASEVRVDLHYLLNRRGLKQWGLYTLLNGEDYTFLCAYPDGG